MKQIKILFIAMEIAALIGLAIILFKVDWLSETQEHVYMYHSLAFLCSLVAVMFQSEQGSIDWNEKEENN